MFHLNISILIVLMLSDICFSASDSENEEDSNDYLIDDSYEYNPNAYYPIEYYTEHPYGYNDDGTLNDQVGIYYDLFHHDVGPSYSREDLNVGSPNNHTAPNVGTSYNREDLNDGQFNIQEIPEVASSNNQGPLNVGPFENQEAPIARKNCIDSIYKVFTKGAKPIIHIYQALDKMILYDEHKYEYEDHVKLYYYSFQYFVNVDKIKPTKLYCTKIETLMPGKEVHVYNKKKHMEIKYFEDKLSYDNILPNFSRTDLQELDTVMGFPYNFSGDTTSSGTSKRAVQLTIFKNALFYHKSSNYDANDNVNRNTIKYFHKARTNGYLYMRHIRGAIELITTKIDTPEDFCNKLYRD